MVGDYDKFCDELSDAIEKALKTDSEGDYTFSVEDAVDGVLDVLEAKGLLLFINDN